MEHHFARLTNAENGEGEWFNPASVARIRRFEGSETRTLITLTSDENVVVKGSAASVAQRLRGVGNPES